MDRDNDWILPNRAGFISWARESLSATANETPGLRPPQAIAKFMMNRFTPLRGILLVHSMGTGKTCSAVAALESWIGREEEIEMEKRPIVLTKSSLIGDFKKKFMESCRNKYFYNPYSLKENSKWVLLEDISELKPYLRSTVRDDREMFKLPILVPAWFSNRRPADLHDLQRSALNATSCGAAVRRTGGDTAARRVRARADVGTSRLPTWRVARTRSWRPSLCRSRPAPRCRACRPPG